VYQINSTKLHHNSAAITRVRVSPINVHYLHSYDSAVSAVHYLCVCYVN